MTEPSSPHLKRSLKTIHLWGIAVGLVISGEYFGWSYGWDKAGTLGFLVTTMAVALMYTAFIFSYTELTTSIPHAGGPFAYSRRAFGPGGGYLAGMATLIEFVFAPPAIALALALVALAAMIYFNPQLFGVFAAFMALGYLYFVLTARQRAGAPADALLDNPAA
jgi:ethanolamine permease